MKQMRKFHETFGIAIGSVPGDFNATTAALRLTLLNEELGELEEAILKYDLVAILDALTDIQAVLDGTYLSLGFADYKDKAYDEVHESNMSKLGEDGRPIVREDGKILKGPNYFKPDLAKILGEPYNMVKAKKFGA